MAEFAVLLEFEDNRKNSRLISALNSSVGQKSTIKRSKDKVLIKEQLFDVLQMEIESADVDYISLMQIKNNKIKTLVKDAELWTEEYDQILRKLRYDRTFA